jgi:hypothetical protein
MILPAPFSHAMNEGVKTNNMRQEMTWKTVAQEMEML